MKAKLICYRWSEEHRVQGYIDTFTHIYQEFRKEWYIFGCKVWSKSLFQEEIPSWVIIGLSTVGFYDDNSWKSKAPKWMHESIGQEI